MRIGELAALVGVSSRTVRHYHRLGLLSEPARLSNGYRDYRLRDAVVLTRVRRLAELGLSLEEIREVLAGDRDRELRDVLVELDADLARQQEAIAARRERLASLLADPELHPDSAVSPEMAAVLRELPTGNSQFARADREMLAFAGALAAPEDRTRLLEALRPLTEPEAVVRVQALYGRLDELAGAAPDDPRIPPLAADLAAEVPEGMRELMRESLDASPEAAGSAGSAGFSGPAFAAAPACGGADGRHYAEAMFEEMPAAHAEVLRLMIAELTRERGASGHRDEGRTEDCSGSEHDAADSGHGSDFGHGGDPGHGAAGSGDGSRS